MRTCTFLDSRQRELCTECGSGLDLCVCVEPDTLALERLKSPPGKFLTEVLVAEEGLPSSENHLFEKITKALGEAAEQLVSHAEQRSPSPDVIRRNLVQLGALLTRLASVGTEEYPYPET